MITSTNLKFDILFDDTFISLVTNAGFTPATNKHVLSIINGFEDGSWMDDKFDNFIWDNIAHTALSSKERDSLAGNPHSLLSQAAKNLRLTTNTDDNGRGSELAEVVLYGIMRHHYGALPVVPKIFYKQNTQDNAKGADSVHIVVTDGDFSIWFGEAKFYNSIENARLDKIVASVQDTLRTDKLKKESSIITSLSDLDQLIGDPSLTKLIRKALSAQDSIDHLKPRLHVPILLLHKCDITKKTHCLTEQYRKDIVDYHRERAIAYFQKQVSALTGVHLYSEIRFHLILFPVPDKDSIVKRFFTSAGHYRGGVTP